MRKLKLQMQISVSDIREEVMKFIEKRLEEMK